MHGRHVYGGAANVVEIDQQGELQLAEFIIYMDVCAPLLVKHVMSTCTSIHYLDKNKGVHV